MINYRKKPVIIQAAQWDGSPAGAREIIDWTRGSETPAHMGDMDGAHQTLYISTLEGEMQVKPYDYVIRGVKGEHYPCKPDIFESTYDLEMV